MSISTHRAKDTYSILIADSVIPRNNHKPIPVDVKKNGQPLTVWLLRGLKFQDEEGEEVTPEGYLSNDEFKSLSTMLEHTDENGVLIERVLPYPWEDIDALVTKKREEAAAESTELGNEQEQQP
jgi:hypothetical protein